MAQVSTTTPPGSITKQPEYQPAPNFGQSVTPTPSDWNDIDDGTVKLPTLAGIKRKVFTREGWLGDFDASRR